MPELTVHQLDVMAAGNWSFRDGALSWTNRPGCASGTFDPFPAYAHDAGVAAAAADTAQELCPPLYDIEIHLANREEIARTNGYSTNCYPRHYVDGEAVIEPPVGLILMSAKRIPPHPAMTRYLVGHEYGHHIAWMLGKLRGAKHLQDESWLADYAQLRGLPFDRVRHHGSGGNWHSSISEIFACDLRMYLGIETEYWPHPGIPRPDEVSAANTAFATWWVDALDELRTAEPIT